ncbi:MAG: sensor histidine kinase [Bacteroidota bacterium]
MNENPENIRNEFEKYLQDIFLKNLTYILAIGSVIIAYYMYSDWVVRENLQSAATRIVPLTLMLLVLGFHLVNRQKHNRLKSILYHVNYMALQFMMFGKCLIHLHDDALAPNVTGAIMVIFLISLDNKLNTRNTAFIYSLPVILFTIVLFVFENPSAKEFYIIADIYPILILGFAINRIQYRLRFQLFKSNRLLKLEQEKTDALYKESLKINEKLDEKAREAILIKEEIQKKNEDLNKSNETKDRFLGIIAHDLKNPMSTIWGMSDILLSDRPLEKEEKQSLLLSINHSIRHTFKLLENLLQWARAQDKTIAFEPFEYDIKTIIEKELEILRNHANKKSIKIINTIPSDVSIYADKKMFQTIIRNLVTNAIKFTFPNDQIDINAKHVVIDERIYTEIAIRDNGTGMSEEQVKQLFVIKKNSSTKGTDEEDGTGLGLLLCKEFIDRHQGMLKVESEPNEGSTFTCLFPYQDFNTKSIVC